MVNKTTMLFIVLVLLVSSCGFKHKKGLEVGESIVILPSPPQDSFSLVTKKYSNVHIIFTNGNKVITFNDQAKITATKADGSTSFQILNTELKQSWEKTKCSRKVHKFLENAYEGDALFCNDSLKLHEIVGWKVELKNGKVKTATSYLTNDVSEEDDLISITVSF